MGSTRIHDLPRGSVDAYDDNELRIKSTMRDPVKLRLSVLADQVESNMGAVSFNLTRADDRDEEMLYAMGRLTANKKGGAFYLAGRDAVTGEMRELFYIDSTVAIFRQPIQAPNIGGGGGGNEYATGISSRSKRYRLQAQDDQLVYYDYGVTPPKPLAALGPDGAWRKL